MMRAIKPTTGATKHIALCRVTAHHRSSFEAPVPAQLLTRQTPTRQTAPTESQPSWPWLAGLVRGHTWDTDGNPLCWLWSSIQKLPCTQTCQSPPFSLWTLLIPAPKEDVSIHRQGDSSAAGSPDLHFSSWASGPQTGMSQGLE